MRDQLGFVRSAHQKAPLVKDTSARRIIVDFLRHAWIDSVKKDVSEFVPTCDRLVVHIRHASQPSRLRIVGEDEELSRGD